MPAPFCHEKGDRTMVIDEVRFTLKDGREAVIRSPREEDAQPMLDFMQQVYAQTDFLLRYPEEQRFTPETEKSYFARMNESKRDAMPVCFIDGTIAGNCQLSCAPNLKLRHRASLAIAVLRKFWGQGVGTQLLQTLIRIAEKDSDLLQLELDYIEGNSRARALYEKMGFRITGVKPDAIRLKDGTLLNEYSMLRKIRR